MPQQFKTLSLTTSLLNPCTLHSCMQKGVFQRQIWISHPPPRNGGPLMISRWYAHVQCCSPSPAYTAIMQTHSTHTHSRAEFGSNKGDQVLLTAQSHHLKKRQRSCFYDVGNRLSSDEDRSMEKTGCSFWIKHLLGFLHYYPSIPLFHLNKRFEHVLVGYISLSPSSLANHWKINQ